MGTDEKIKYVDLTGMTADERLEKLLNRFGQTISDLPKSRNEDYAYDMISLDDADREAVQWQEGNLPGYRYSEDYICHLADVIDRLETALENASKIIDCLFCKNDCRLNSGTHLECDFHINNIFFQEN